MGRNGDLANLTAWDGGKRLGDGLCGLDKCPRPAQEGRQCGLNGADRPWSDAGVCRSTCPAVARRARLDPGRGATDSQPTALLRERGLACGQVARTIRL